ncbi:MAG: pyrroline-5-carboxylate reductase [Bacteroidales bacterium]|nr:pyrroline-5-carboxylate reductase [Bacteroidales bacterium]
MGQIKMTIIGGGNMGGAIAKGVVNANVFQPADVTITRRNHEALNTWAADGFKTSTDNNAAVAEADIVIFAVKPFQIADVIASVKNTLKPGSIAVSIATGVSVAQLTQMLGPDTPAVRVMPNTAAEVRESLTAIVPSPSVTPGQLQKVQDIFQTLGLALVVPEEQMPALTALASCGIAHALRYIRAAQESAIEMGINSRLAAQIVAQTVKGAAQLILTNNSHPEAEIDKVCTPKGVTIAGINAMEHAGFTSAVMKGMMGSYEKIIK